jgi:hypothetical protein
MAMVRSRQLLLTVRKVMSWRPCEDWPERRLLEYAAGRKSVSVITVLRDETLSTGARIFVGANALQGRHAEIGYWAADRAVHIHALAALEMYDHREQADLIRALPPVTNVAPARIAHRMCREARHGMQSGYATDALEDASRAAGHAYPSREAAFFEQPPTDLWQVLQYAARAAQAPIEDRHPTTLSAAFRAEQLVHINHILDFIDEKS